MTLYPCKRKNVYALLLLPNGNYFIGQNLRCNDITSCPRVSAAPSELYSMCQTVCETIGHAEAVAIENALRGYTPGELRGSRMFIFGHNYQCENCKKLCQQYGIEVVAIVDNLGDSSEYHLHLPRLPVPVKQWATGYNQYNKE
jgi:deoxycytidylate deaminase